MLKSEKELKAKIAELEAERDAQQSWIQNLLANDPFMSVGEDK